MEKTATIAERNRAIKKELVKIYGAKNVSLTGSRGTAYGWITIKVLVAPTPGHKHENKAESWRCENCRPIREKEQNKIRELAHKVAKEIGSYIGSYSSDDGYGTEHDNMHVEVEFK